MTTRWSLTLGAVYGLLTVTLGAFGAHGLQSHVDSHLLDTWSTATHYLGLHALVLLVLGSLSAQRPRMRVLGLAAWCFVLGALVFSGSLFVLVLTGIRSWGVVTPFGGSVLIVGWVLLAIGAWRGFAADRT